VSGSEFPEGAGPCGGLARRLTVAGALVLSLALLGANAAALGREATARADRQPAITASPPVTTAALGIRG